MTLGAAALATAETINFMVTHGRGMICVPITQERADAVADARDGDSLSFDPDTRQLRNVTQDKTYTPVPLSAKVVKDGPILGNVQQGDDVNIESFPAPRWHPGDGGRAAVG